MSLGISSRWQQSPLAQVSDTVVRMCRKSMSQEKQKAFILMPLVIRYEKKLFEMTETKTENEDKRELAYKRKARKRGKNRKVRLSMASEPRNILLAVKQSRKGKNGKKGVIVYDMDAEGNNARIKQMLDTHSYHTSPGHDCMRRCPCGKVRRLHKLPYYPDHIIHHAVMQVLMPYFVRALYKESGASVKGRGMMYAKKRTERWIDEHRSAGRIYYVKLDFVKFYENVDQAVICQRLCEKFGDEGIRYALHEIVTALPKGLGIGLYPIQTLTNYYMSIFCRIVCRLFDVKVEIYCDDVVVLGIDKKEVWKAVNFILGYARDEMHQPLHDGFGMQIVDYTHFLDFVGYRFYFGHTLLRKRMREKFKRAMHNLRDPLHRYRAAMSYKGWLMHCDGFNLWRKVTGMESFDDFEMPRFEDRDADGKRIFQGRKGSIAMIINQPMTLLDVEFGVRSQYGKGVTNLMQVQVAGITYKLRSNNSYLEKQLHWFEENGHLPLRGWRFINWNMTGVGNPDYRIVRPDWTPEIGF